MIVAAFLSDRGDLYIDDCLASFNEHVDLDLVAAHEIFDDQSHHLGMAGNVKAAWSWARDVGADYLLHIEEDFRFTDTVPLEAMLTILDRTDLAQVVLKRQPWSPAEIQAGGQIETNPDAYTQREGLLYDWVEHETLFSMNPSLIPRRTLELEWRTDHPGGVERAITEACRAKGMRFAYYGHRADPPRCEHVGHIRSAGYRW